MCARSDSANSAILGLLSPALLQREGEERAPANWGSQGRPAPSGNQTEPASSRMRLNSAFVSGVTERRDWRISRIFLRSLSAFNCSKVTGVLSDFTGTRSTTTQSPSLAVGSG